MVFGAKNITDEIPFNVLHLTFTASVTLQDIFKKVRDNQCPNLERPHHFPIELWLSQAEYS